jgi:hypothetical protein
MLRTIRLALVSVISSLVIAGCAAGAAPDTGAGDGSEDTSTAQEALRGSGWYRNYYSDSSYQTAVGYEMYDCDNSHEVEGTKTNYYKQTLWSCPDNPFPFTTTTECYDCVTYTEPDGSHVTTCTHYTCA